MRAQAPSGTWQPPSSLAKSARSAVTAARVSAWSSCASKSSTSWSSARASIPRAPWPTAGRLMSVEITSLIRSLQPSRSSPALASTTASYSPCSALRSRVSTLPRSSCMSRSGRWWRNWDWRRRLLVPTRAPGGKSLSFAPRLCATKQSRTSSRWQIAGNASPAGVSVGTSFMLCTARSTRPSNRASSNSLMKTPLRPIWLTFACWNRSPEIILIKTSGDRFQQANVNQIGLKGVFIKELEDALFEGRVDLAVHSMKDVPTETPAGVAFPAICQREDVRDCLVAHKRGAKLSDLPPGARVGTSSLRRQSQLRHHRPDLDMHELRGNVDTRLRKAEQGEYDAVVLAKAGLDRLGWSDRISEAISTDISLPAVW